MESQGTNQEQLLVKEMGARLAELRKFLGIKSQGAFGEMFGLTEGSVGRYERGEFEPKLSLLRKICEVTGANPSFLLFGELPILREPPAPSKGVISSPDNFVQIHLSEPSQAATHEAAEKKRLAATLAEILLEYSGS